MVTSSGFALVIMAFDFGVASGGEESRVDVGQDRRRPMVMVLDQVERPGVRPPLQALARLLPSS